MNVKNSAGFSLIGMVLVLIVLGVALSTTALLVPNLESKSRGKTVEVLKANKSALIGFATGKGRLPPYDSHTYENVVPSPVDGYQNSTVYAYDSRLTSANSICSTPSTYITVDSLSNVAFVIWSVGRNGKVNGDTSPDKTSGAKSSAVTIPNSTYSNNNTASDFADDTDDMLEWVTLDELKKSVGCEELESRSTLEILADEMPVGWVGDLYDPVTFRASGGSGSGYQWCVESDAINSGLLSGNVSFDALISNASNGCASAAYSTATTITLSGTVSDTAFDLNDGSVNGELYSLRVFLKDGQNNRLSRLFQIRVMRPTLVIDSRVVSEPDGVSTIGDVFTVTMNRASKATVSVNYATGDPLIGVATAGVDYIGTSGTLTFSPGETTKTIAYTVNGDDVNEANESFWMTLSNAVNGAIITSPGIATITDNDAVEAYFTSSSSSVNEGSTTGAITVSLSRTSSADVVIGLSTSGTATSGADYTAPSATVTVPAGSLSTSFALATLADADVESNETAVLSLTGIISSAGTATVGALNTHTVTIVGP